MKKVFLALFVAALVALGGFLFVTQHAAMNVTTDCDHNAIIRCGVTSQANLNTHIKTNATHDLPAVFSHYQLTPAVLARTARWGTVYKDGTIKVDGAIVATGAHSVGRQTIPGSSKVVINGKAYYERAADASFRANSMPALVYLDEYGKFGGAVLSSGGNPMKAHSTPKPVFLCKALTVSQLPGKRDQFSFQASAFVRDASFQYLTYVVKDAKGKVIDQVKATDLTVVHYTRTQPGNYTVEAVVTAKVNGKLMTAPVGNCTKPFEVKGAPAEKCTVPGKEQLAKTSPDCVNSPEACALPGKTHLPKDSPECKADTATPLPHSGPTGLVGVFVGVSVAGAAAHQLVTRRRR